MEMSPLAASSNPVTYFSQFSQALKHFTKYNKHTVLTKYPQKPCIEEHIGCRIQKTSTRTGAKHKAQMLYKKNFSNLQ